MGLFKFMIYLNLMDASLDSFIVEEPSYYYMDSERPVCWGKRTQELFSVFLYHQNLGNYNLTHTYNIFSRLPFSFGLCFLPQMYFSQIS